MSVRAAGGDPCRIHLRVPGHVDQQLAHRAVNDRCADPVQVLGHLIVIDVYLQLVVLLHLFSQPFEGRNQAELLQDRRTELRCEAAHIPHHPLQHFGDLIERRIGRMPALGRAQHIELDDGGIQFLPESVVQVTGDHLSLAHFRQRQLAREAA